MFGDERSLVKKNCSICGKGIQKGKEKLQWNSFLLENFIGGIKTVVSFINFGSKI